MLDIAADSARPASRALVLAEVCASLSAGARKDAANILRCDYPYAPEAVVPRRYGPVECTRVFVRDGFIDRYTGD